MRKGVNAATAGWLAVGVFMLFFGGMSEPAAAANSARSPLGINLAGVSNYSSEIPLLNIFQMAGGWITHSSSKWDTGEERYLKLDASGWPVSLEASNHPGAQEFNSVAVLLLVNLPNTENGNYPGGKYIVLYDGQGTIEYSLAAVKLPAQSRPGRDVISVTPSEGAGIHLVITKTDPDRNGNYIRNIRVVRADDETALAGGQIFNPRFLSLLQGFRVIRFMDWLQTNNNTLAHWANRPVPTNAFWGSDRGMPLEVVLAAANAASADPWLNVPVMADNGYIRQMATLARSKLGASQKVYVELSNEVWNSSFSQFGYAQDRGHASFAAGQGSPFDYNRNWYGMRTAQMCDIWKSVWQVDATRVVCVLAGQAVNPYTATESLLCPFWKGKKPCLHHGIDAVAIAPYFGGQIPSAWTTQSDQGLNSLLVSLTSQNDPGVPAGGWLNQVSEWEKAYVAALASYHLPLLAYEGGQGFVSFPNGVTAGGVNTPLTNLYIAANRHPQMADAYTKYLSQWRANGGQLFVVFSDASAYTQYGEWGLLESIMQTVDPLDRSPPKWQAVQNFIAANDCWWPGCARDGS